jgi:hypothetical protein
MHPTRCRHAVAYSQDAALPEELGSAGALFVFGGTTDLNNWYSHTAPMVLKTWPAMSLAPPVGECTSAARGWAWYAPSATMNASDHAIAVLPTETMPDVNY